jgi:hypothetical protein
VNPRGIGINNTISRAKLAALASAIIHGYSHISTDSLTSMHQIKKQLSSHTQTSTAATSREMSSNPFAKAIHQSPLPVNFHKSHAGIIGNGYADTLARKFITIYFDVADTSIITAGPEGNPFYISTGLQKNMKNAEFTKSSKHSPVTYRKALVSTYQITMTNNKHTCTPSTN